MPTIPGIVATTALCLAAMGACFGCKSKSPCVQNKTLVRAIEYNLPIALYYYKGNAGAIGNGLYIRRADASNAIYSFSKGILIGADSRDLDTPQILKITVKDEDNISIEYTDALDFNSKNFYVVFSKDDIYILEFAERKFGKYHRTIQQYIDEK